VEVALNEVAELCNHVSGGEGAQVTTWGKRQVFTQAIKMHHGPSFTVPVPAV